MFKWHNDGTGIPPKIGIPMVCFCDIPLSKVKDHLSWYGEYGIGLDKKWGIDQGISPILYIDPLSATTEAMIGALSAYNKIWLEGLKAEKDYPDLMKAIEPNLLNALERFMAFSKPYVGHFEHNGKKDEEKVFYDEREWRFVPDLKNKPIKQFLYSSDPNFAEVRAKNLSGLTKDTDLCITVTPSNIKYIVVENEKDIVPIMNKLEAKFGDQNYSQNTMKKLMTNIITTKQIREDF